MNSRCIFSLDRSILQKIGTTFLTIIFHSHVCLEVLGHPFSSPNVCVLRKNCDCGPKRSTTIAYVGAIGQAISDSHPQDDHHQPLTPLQNSHYTWIRSRYPCRFGTKSNWTKSTPAGLVWRKEGLKARVTSVKTVLGLQCSSGSHTSPSSGAITWLTLHLNQV